jgi:hypothetical protein
VSGQLKVVQIGLQAMAGTDRLDGPIRRVAAAAPAARGRNCRRLSFEGRRVAVIGASSSGTGVDGQSLGPAAGRHVGRTASSLVRVMRRRFIIWAETAGAKLQSTESG